MAQPKPNRVPRICGHCGSLARVQLIIDGSDRCPACAQYFRRCGVDRPAILLERKKAQQAGLHLCGKCRRTLQPEDFHANQSECKACQRDHYLKWVAANPDAPRRWHKKWAEAGGARDSWQRRKARLLAAFVAPVESFAIFERDRWRCGLCGRSVPKNVKAPDRRSASLDHIIPLAAGGTHEPANVQLAHLGCNSAKGARGGGEQMLLFG